ncbi:MAG TPA: HTH domain-containing protein, partial [Polyangiaceae bacterium LLY-WYZ-15_(1-7)]|nr:HTH domain-containing protein [Polyangiaceae bacterium LLY-WYZ-15_(1-7)]
MTFTEAAVEVLRLVAKPLHYKKITEIAIERNLLSHVGKTPEVTMSSRLATMVRKDRGEAPIIKVKPGVFGLREFSKEVLDAAQHESGHDYELPKEPADAKGEAKGDESAQKKGDAGKGDAGKGDAESSAEKGDDDEKKKAEAKESPKLPGAEMFPEEEDDDEPILAKIESGGGDDDDEPKRRGKRRRRRRRKDDDDKRSGGRGGKSDDDKSDDGGGSKRGGRSRRSRGGKGRDRSSSSSSRSSRSSRDREAAALQGEWEREP